MTLHLRFSGINGLGSRFSSWPLCTLKLRATSTLVRLPGQSPPGLTRRLCYSPYVVSANSPANPTDCQHQGGPSLPSEVTGPGPLPALCDVTLEGRWVLRHRLAGVEPHLASGGVEGQSHSPPVCEWLEQTCCHLSFKALPSWSPGWRPHASVGDLSRCLSVCWCFWGWFLQPELWDNEAKRKSKPLMAVFFPGP